LAAARYRTFNNHYTPPALTLFADGLYLSSGLLNVLLYAYTRPFLFPHTDDDGSDNQSISIHSEFAQIHDDLPGPTMLSNTLVTDRDPSLIEPKSAGSGYDAPQIAHHSPGVPSVNISDEV
jgi:hypothetical protein